MQKILIVDDMEVSLMMAENMLAGEYETVCASSGEEAVELYRKEHPDMVLSDLRMPGMTGFELQQILQKEHNETIPFMFMTADHDEETETAGFDNGAMDFIRKPFRPDVLRRRIGNIMQTVGKIQGLKKHAAIDSLTGLLNKAAAEEELKSLCHAASGLLMMIDLDSFKLVNDIYGHSMGDKILISFADIIRSAMRPTDLIARFGGDEFIAFCHGMDETGMAHKSDFINDKLVKEAKRLMGDDMNIPLGASLGGVSVPKEGVEFNELYKKADKALYIVKQNGKHGWHIYTEEHESKENAEFLATANRLENVEKILGERNIKGGALALSFEQFRMLYRFAKRAVGDALAVSCLVLMVLENEPPAAVHEEFMTTLQKTLRKGDAVTQNGAREFIVLLTGTGAQDMIHAVKRVKSNWEALPSGNGRKYPFSFDWMVIDK